MNVIVDIVFVLFAILYLVVEYLEHKFIKDILEIQGTQIDILNKRIKIMEELKEQKGK